MKPYYEHNGITIYHSDLKDVIPKFPLGSWDLVLTDPPYGLRENAHRVASRTKLAKTTDYGDFAWDAEPASDEEIDLTVSAAARSIIFGGNYFHLPPQRGWLVWDKLNSGNFADCELAWTNLPTSVRIFRHRWNGMIRQSERDVKRVHPAQKPVALMKWCITLSKTDGAVLDPFMGSGTTLVAAKVLGLKATGIEISERYCEIAAKRLSQETLGI